MPDAETEEGGEIDEGLEAELAGFAALLSQHRHQVADGQLPGQLDLTELTDDPTDHDHGDQGQR